MGIMDQGFRLSSWVRYDDYDAIGFLVDIKQNRLHELNTADTGILTTILHCETLAEALQELDPSVGEEQVLTFLERLRQQYLLKPLTAPCDPLCEREPPPQSKSPLDQPVTWKQRIVGAGHLLCVLDALRMGDAGLERAYQYLEVHHHIPNPTLAPDRIFQRVRDEYWFYRLVIGLVEKRIAHVLGQHCGNEGLCLIRAFGLCAYLLGLSIPSNMILARAKYGSCEGFKMHSWVEDKRGRPLNERPNIRDAYRIMDIFPSS